MADDKADPAALPEDVQELLVDEKPKDDPIKSIHDTMGVMKDIIARQDQRLSQFEQKFGSIEQDTKEIRNRSLAAEQRGFARAQDEIVAEMRKAVAEADTTKYDALVQQLRDLDRFRPGEPKKEPAQPSNQANPNQQQNSAAVPPEVNTWVASNSWFMSDPEMNRWATNYDAFLTNTKPGVPLARRLEMVTEAVKNEFPNKFDNPRRSNAAAVSSPNQSAAGRAPNSRTREKTFSDIPEDMREHARAAFQKLQRQIPGYTEKDYLSTYQF